MSALSIPLTHRKFTVDEYHSFIEQGVFRPEERIELWEGEFIEMSPIGKRHAGVIAGLTAYLNHLFFQQFVIWAQNPIVLNDFSEPQPDICVLQGRDDFYRNESATAADVLLVIEVADTSIKFDRDVKFPRYAASGIRESWLVDLENERVEIHSEPTAMGYSLIKVFHRGQTAESSILPPIKLAVEEILG